MLQLNHQIPINKFAFINSETTASLLYLEFSQDLNLWKTYATASATITGSYVVCILTGSQIPTASGLYTVNIYEPLVVTDLVWSTWTGDWITQINQWSSYSGSSISYNYFIDEERAWVSGSDYVNFTTYTGSQQQAFYYTYR